MISNLALSCQGCNSYKHARTEAVDPVSGERVPLYNPRQHPWREHFAWSDERIHVIGLTPIGRATIVALDLNRTGVLNLRRVLLAFVEHPPPWTLDEE